RRVAERAQEIGVDLAAGQDAEVHQPASLGAAAVQRGDHRAAAVGELVEGHRRSPPLDAGELVGEVAGSTRPWTRRTRTVPSAFRSVPWLTHNGPPNGARSSTVSVTPGTMPSSAR